MRNFLKIATLWLACLVTQVHAAGTDSIVLQGADLKAPLTIDAALMHSLPRQHVQAVEHGHTEQFDGVWLLDVLKKAGAPLGESLRGGLLRTVLSIQARDGYAVLFSLAELDDGFRQRPVLLADRRDGKPLSDAEGPLRLVVADEKRPARWIRQISSMTLVRVAP